MLSMIIAICGMGIGFSIALWGFFGMRANSRKQTCEKASIAWDAFGKASQMQDIPDDKKQTLGLIALKLIDRNDAPIIQFWIGMTVFSASVLVFLSTR